MTDDMESRGDRRDPVSADKAQVVSASDQVCGTCNGSGQVRNAHCPACGGSGHRFSPGQRQADDKPAVDESYHVQPNFPP